MKAKGIKKKEFYKSAGGPALAVLCGLLLWKAPFGEAWVNASYDYLFRFGTRTVTNKVTLILMDNESYSHFHQTREQPWDRELHAQLLNKLTADGCSLVVFDSFFRTPRDQVKDKLLAEALHRQRHVVLMAEQSQVTHPSLAGAQPTLPAELFLNAAGTNWGVAWLDPDLDLIVRRHWPFPSPGPYPSLPQRAAQLAGVTLDAQPHEQWLRYYGREGAWTKLGYKFALDQPANYFHNQIVFIGTQPKTSVPGEEQDEFRSPYTRWTGESMGGVEIMATSFLNLVNGDWLRRPDWKMEMLLLVAVGLLLGVGLNQMRPLTACIVAASIGLAITLGAAVASYFTNYWFPWLTIVGGQVPCALAWTLATARTRQDSAIEKDKHAEKTPDIPGYELFHPPFGEGAYGKVWLAKNEAGQWRALKIVYLAKFNQSADPYDREYNGVSRYKPISDKHPGLLRIDFVSEKMSEYFYYVMELGDSLVPGWEREPAIYKPRDLVSERASLPNRRLNVRECLRIGLVLTDTLGFLHQHGLTHRDIKPQNIIFVEGQPKLADLGLIAEIRPTDQERTYVGTPGYMPPPPERPGTPQADIYALGMMFYVLITGRNTAYFPELATTLFDEANVAGFLPFNAVIIKACQPEPSQRYTSAAEMHHALQEVENRLQDNDIEGKTHRLT